MTTPPIATPELDALDAAIAQAQDLNEQTAGALRDAAERSGHVRQNIYDAIASLTPPVSVVTRMGFSMSKWNHGVTQTDAGRCYNDGDVDEAISQYRVRDVTLSMDSGTSAQVMGDKARSIWQQYAGTSLERLFLARGNEVNRKVTSASAIANYCTQGEAVGNAIRQTPNSYFALNVTGYGIRQGDVDAFEPIAPFIDVFAANPYSPGRQDKPPTWTPYEQYIDPCVQMAAAWGVKAYATWENGMPINPNDPQKRPSYMAGAAQHTKALCDSLGLDCFHLLYWDSVKLVNGQPDPNEPDNRFQNDKAAANPKTVTAWLSALA